MHTAVDEELSIPKSIVTGRMAQWRMLIGLLQGLALYLLYWSLKNTGWPLASPYPFAPLLMIALFVPVLLVSGLGHVQKRQLVIWIAIAVALCIVLGVHDIWRGGFDSRGWFGVRDDSGKIVPSGLVLFFTATGFYIAHALVLASAMDRRRIARYPSYFEAAWKLIIQIKFSVLFVCVLWLILWLGASLFMLVKLNFLRELLERAWFAIPVTVFAFATALHVTDVRPGIVRGIRSLLLVLMSWLLPITTLMVGGFLVSLPFVGLAPLWATRHATSVLLGSMAVLIVLINAAFQGGELGKQVATVLRVAARIACLLLLPMAVIAVYSLALRVQQYGWTSDRIIAATTLLVAVCYACGYLAAALQRGTWLARIAPTNTATAFVILAVLVALFTPIADPARLSVASQLARLENGKVSAEKFDFSYLKFEGARYGNEALQMLKTRTTGADADTIRTRAEAALLKKNKWSPEEESPIADAKSRAANITVWPNTASLPAEFVRQNWDDKSVTVPQCLRLQKHHCDAYLLDLNEDGREEILLKDSNSYGPMTVFALDANSGKWAPSGDINMYTNCKEVTQALAAKDYRLVVPAYRDIDVAGRRLRVVPRNTEQSKCTR